MKNFERGLRLAGLSLLAGFCISTAYAADWPQWRGANRDAHSAETGLLRAWRSEGPKLLWQTSEVGGGYGTPAIVGGNVYLLGNEGIDNEFLLCLSAKDGKKLWSLKLGKVGHPEQEPKYPGARSTPTVDSGRVFALGSDGDLVCVDAAAGKEAWRKNLRTEFGGKYGEWAYAESPLVDGDVVVCTPGGKGATLVALNRETGDLVWKCALPSGDDASYASMVAATFSGVKQYVQFLSKGLVGVHAETGELLWRYERSAKGTPAAIVTPLVSDGCIYTGAFRAGGALVKPIKTEGRFEVEEVYFDNKLPFSSGGVIKIGDYFYGTTGQALLCVNYKTGQLKWEERAGILSWLAADGRLYAQADKGEVLLIEPSSEEYREVSRFTPPGRPSESKPAFTHPALADGQLYIRQENILWCFDVKKR